MYNGNKLMLNSISRYLTHLKALDTTPSSMRRSICTITTSLRMQSMSLGRHCSPIVTGLQLKRLVGGTQCINHNEKRNYAAIRDNFQFGRWSADTAGHLVFGAFRQDKTPGSIRGG